MPSVTLSPASAAPTAPAATSIRLLEGIPLPLASVLVQEQVQATEAPRAVSTYPGLGGSCLWVGLGLILIVTGAVLLLRWRRSE